MSKWNEELGWKVKGWYRVQGIRYKVYVRIMVLSELTLNLEP